MGSKVRIRRLVWESRYERHMLVKHNVVRDEVVDVVFGNPLPKRGKIRKRLVVLGKTEANRLLEVVLENRGDGLYCPITAYDASPEDRALYTRERGGEEAQ